MLARKLGVSGLMYRALTQPSIQADVPDFVLTRLRTAYHIICASGIRRQHEFFILQEQCERLGIGIIILKGFSLAQIAYGDLGVRSSGVDLDVLVLEQNKEAVIRMLRDQGFTVHLQGGRHSVSFKKDLKHIDVHWNFLPLGLRVIPIEKFWERSGEIIVDEKKVRVLSFEDSVIVSALQIRHDWPFLSLIRLMDIHALIMRYGDSFDWKYLQTVAASAELNSTLIFSLNLCKELLQTPLLIKGPNLKVRIFLGVIRRRYEAWFVLRLANPFVQGSLRILKFLLIDNYLYYLGFQIKLRLNRLASRIYRASCAKENHQRNPC